MTTPVDITVNLPGLAMKNPIMPASGTFGYGDFAWCQSLDLNRLGALVIKTTTLEEREGNPQPQIWVGDDFSINAVGLKNPGIDCVIKEKLPALKEKYPDLPIIGSVGGSTMEDYCRVAELFSQSGRVNALELNISCPNVHEGGMSFGTDPKVAMELTQKVKAVIDCPLYVKLTPNVTDVVSVAKAVEEGGADGLTLINTLFGMHIDVEKRQPVIANVMGGVSGKPLKALAVRMVYQVRQATNLPIIGVGGIETVDDVIELFLAGANAVQVGTAHFKDAEICDHLAQALPQRLQELGFDRLDHLAQIFH